jgi:hypothetical protein
MYSEHASHFEHEGIFAFTPWTNSISWESCQVAIHNRNSQWSQVSILYQNIEALNICPHILVPFSCGTKSQFVSFSLDRKTVSICAIYLDLVSCQMEPTGTGQENVTCPVGSTLSWSAEFKHRHISANAVHVWGDWQHLKGHWVKGERQCHETCYMIVWQRDLYQPSSYLGC